MQISKNKKFQYTFFLILANYIILNGGNSNLLIQLNFILVALFFLFCLNDKNYKAHLYICYLNNKKSILFYLIFLLFLVFQILPLPVGLIEILSPEKYKFLNMINGVSSSTISLSPSNSFFQLLNFSTLLLFVFLLNMIFYTERHKYRFYVFLSFSGFISAIVAVLFYLYGNPDFFIFTNSNYKNASSGFFINRTVLSVFLLFCLISSLELLKNFERIKINHKKDNFFLKIYIRLFIVFITIGIITSFSRIANFLLIITVFFYFFREIFIIKSKNSNFKLILLLILIFDFLIIGFYFGASELFDRFYFLKEDFSSIPGDISTVSRFDIIKFSIKEFNNFILFGYGAGSFENLFQLKFINSGNLFTNHAHSDLFEFLGEFGIVGLSILLLSLIKFCFIVGSKFLNILLIFYLGLILFFDFSLHIPIIQILFITSFYFSRKSIQ